MKITIDFGNGRLAVVVPTEEHLPPSVVCSAERAEDATGQRQGK